MFGFQWPCWIIRVRPPVSAPSMVEPLAARSKMSVRRNLPLAACFARPPPALSAFEMALQHSVGHVYHGDEGQPYPKWHIWEANSN